ncbi:hypothetical protein HIM_02225 [Hirsutella minnesotensis 3608]|nr:hypothetical protein HIM_02225 [Hirsutella minnesotensis 3608]
MQGPDGYNPETGEWIAADKIVLARSLYGTLQNMDFISEDMDVSNPTAEGIGSPHTQACVEVQRAKLYHWAIVCGNSNNANNIDSFPQAFFKCRCTASGTRGWMWLRGIWGKNKDGKDFCGFEHAPELLDADTPHASNDSQPFTARTSHQAQRRSSLRRPSQRRPSQRRVHFAPEA